MTASRRCLFAILALASVCIAWGASTPTTEGPDLHDLMKGVKKNLKVVGQSLQDPAADARALAALVEMETLLLASKAHDPSNLSEVPRDARDAHRSAYRADMARVLVETLNLEVALLEGRREDAVKILKESLYAMREAGHEAYQDGDEH